MQYNGYIFGLIDSKYNSVDCFHIFCPPTTNSDFTVWAVLDRKLFRNTKLVSKMSRNQISYRHSCKAFRQISFPCTIVQNFLSKTFKFSIGCPIPPKFSAYMYECLTVKDISWSIWTKQIQVSSPLKYFHVQNILYTSACTLHDLQNVLSQIIVSNSQGLQMLSLGQFHHVKNRSKLLVCSDLF